MKEENFQNIKPNDTDPNNSVMKYIKRNVQKHRIKLIKLNKERHEKKRGKNIH